MSGVKAPLQLRIKNSARGVLTCFANPAYIALALVLSFLMTGLLIWSINLDLLRFTLFEAPISLLDKLRIIWDVQTGIYSAYTSIQATGMILFGLLFGINFALIIKVIRGGSFSKIPKKSGGTSVVFAVIAGGCVACGTSLLTPLLATLSATASISVSQLSNILTWISIILVLYSIYALGSVVNNAQHNKTA